VSAQIFQVLNTMYLHHHAQRMRFFLEPGAETCIGFGGGRVLMLRLAVDWQWDGSRYAFRFTVVPAGGRVTERTITPVGVLDLRNECAGIVLVCRAIHWSGRASVERVLVEAIDSSRPAAASHHRQEVPKP
jgi:hypothetical protein